VEKSVKVNIPGMCARHCAGDSCEFCCILENKDNPCYAKLDQCVRLCPDAPPHLV
jgi:hypothetical protein